MELCEGKCFSGCLIAPSLSFAVRQVAGLRALFSVHCSIQKDAAIQGSVLTMLSLMIQKLIIK